MQEKRWSVEIHIDEHDGRTRARARLRNKDETGLAGMGFARLNPTDVDIPEIGDELAVSRALADLAHQLLDAAADDISGLTGRPAHLTH
jgi:Domain of unknown function (DUF1876)